MQCINSKTRINGPIDVEYHFVLYPLLLDKQFNEIYTL